MAYIFSRPAVQAPRQAYSPNARTKHEISSLFYEAILAFMNPEPESRPGSKASAVEKKIITLCATQKIGFICQGFIRVQRTRPKQEMAEKEKVRGL
jgi:hypothetical protein